MKMKKTPTTSTRRGITAPQGFRAAGIHCGIKKTGLLDLALVVSEQSGPIAGVFTKNQVVAAPVIVDRLHLRKGIGRAILVNSGNANACTGAKGLAAAKKTATLIARQLDVPIEQVFIGSTGVIGRVLPVNRIIKGIPQLLPQLRARGGPAAGAQRVAAGVAGLLRLPAEPRGAGRPVLAGVVHRRGFRANPAGLRRDVAGDVGADPRRAGGDGADFGG